MYSMSHPVSAPMNGGLPTSIMEGTINPAQLNSSAPITTSSSITQSSPRGVKRSRSPDYADTGEGNEDHARKRGKHPKSRVSESPVSASHSVPPQIPPAVQTPSIKAHSIPQTSPSQSSPTKTTPTGKSTVLKALPTVRDHTTDQLNPEGDEYIPREYDDGGEKKVTANGQVLDNREYRCRTFYVPDRGNKLFMLATECARVLGYRDSYLLFNKNRSLYKIIASQAEKDHLIAQEILPYSYRSRQIAIVTARSMFRQFGSRLINNGRRVRDDYWESKARKQGFTEEDAAGEKRPGAAKQREAAAAEASNVAALTALPHGEIIYSNGPGLENMQGATLAPQLPMVQLAPTDDLQQRDYSNVQRPRHEIAGPAYQDRMHASNTQEMTTQSLNTAEYNKSLQQQRSARGKYLEDYWKRPHEPVVASPRQQTAEGDTAHAVSQGIQSPHLATSGPGLGGQSGIMSHQQQVPAQMMNHQAFSQQQTHAQNPVAQSPIRSMHQSIRPDQMHHRSPSLSLGQPGGPHTQAGTYYGQNQMWPPSQPQPSPLQAHHPMQQYNQHMQQQSPHLQQSPLHAQQGLQHQHSAAGQIRGSSMGYPGLPAGGMGAPQGYGNVGHQQMYQPSPSPQHFMHQQQQQAQQQAQQQQQTTGSQQSGMQGWAPPGQGWQYGGGQ
ncbi:hypothetical protein K402DRAFT_273788 [Aulographum hederae CBS 113979]|uniref:RSC complex subunit Rsc7 n=1 Tax=Aulographum hederae CBS 113979 TaxID=1176131 RepID=A0A6G1H8V5_9PEZI|nr:hypothetical protein K402DRAFT_273788 [Aulographum hederae CBS 113979]